MSPLPKNKGALAEHIAIAWLLNQEYEVFENVSQHGAIDLIATKGDEILKIDVKTESITKYKEKEYHLFKPDGAAVLRAAYNGIKFLIVNPQEGSCKWAA